MPLLKSRCTLCSQKIPKDKIVKFYKAANGEWKKCCVSCFKGVPTKTEKPGTQYHINNDRQWRLF